MHACVLACLQVMDMAAAISELPAGGQVLLGPTSLARISSRLLVSRNCDCDCACACACADWGGGSEQALRMHAF